MAEADFVFLLGQMPNSRAPGQDGLPFELLWHTPKRMQTVVLSCINTIMASLVVARGINLLSAEEGGSGVGLATDWCASWIQHINVCP